MAWILTCVWAVLLTGCGGGDRPPPPATVQVSGTVTLDSQPMQGGEVRFYVTGQPAKILKVQAGAIAGEVFVGQNRIEVVWLQEGPPNPMDPAQKILVNVVDTRFSGAQSPFRQEIPLTGASDLKFAVTSSRTEAGPEN
ncbi:MAG: hypothetical protein GTO03_17555 [Planctomycetales bacterium]|nr:hypothetical protein [Planctomycetales bacterium]